MRRGRMHCVTQQRHGYAPAANDAAARSIQLGYSSSVIGRRSTGDVVTC